MRRLPLMMLLVSAAAAASLGDDATRLTDGRYDDSRPAWSPDGGAVAFVSQRDAGAALVVVDLDAGAERILLERDARDTAAWHPSGQTLAVATRRDRQRVVALVSRCGGDERVHGPGSAAAFHPTRELLAVVRDSDVFVCTIDGAQADNVTRHGRRAVIEGVAWSPAGDVLYYARDGDLWRVALDGGEPRRLVNHAAESVTAPTVADPVVTADGARVFYALRTDGLYGGVSTNLFGVYDVERDASRTVAEADAWSVTPDGRHVVASMGGEMRLIAVDDGSAIPLGPGRDPAVSPDGTRLAFVVRDEPFGPGRIVVVPLERDDE